MKSIEICIKELGCAVVPTKGTSMRPLLNEGETLVELADKGFRQLKRGDVILYKKNDGTLVLHRIIKEESEHIFTVLGDHQFKNAERVNEEQIIAVAQGFYINGRYVNEKTWWYWVYKKIWLSNLQIRRCCLAFLNLIQK
ncbi:MAG: S24/S26 family peptidase [Clostridia bacterium]